MALSCNINNRGRIARAIYGIVLLLTGAALILFWAIPQPSIWRWVIAIICILSGGFGVFEALRGWCMMRAMGFKTPM